MSIFCVPIDFHTHTHIGKVYLNIGSFCLYMKVEFNESRGNPMVEINYVTNLCPKKEEGGGGLFEHWIFLSLYMYLYMYACMHLCVCKESSHYVSRILLKIYALLKSY